MKKIFAVVFTSMSVFSLYAAEGAAIRQPLHDCDIWLSEKTIEGETDLYYMLYSTSGVDKGMFIAYANDFATLTEKYDLTAKQFEQIAHQQAAYIKGLAYINQQLEDVNDAHVRTSKLYKKMNKENSQMTLTAQALASAAHNASMYKNKIIKNAIRMLDVGIALGLSMQLYQWYGMQ